MLFFSDIPWTALYQRPQHLATRFAGREQLCWIEPVVLGRLPHRTPIAIREGIKGVALPFLPFNARNGMVRAVARVAGGIGPVRASLDRIQGGMLAAAMRRGEISRTDAIAFLQNFHALRAARGQRPRMIVYDCIDNPFGFSPLPSSSLRLWRETLDTANLLTATSPVLADLIFRTSGRRAAVVSNGVESFRFSTPVPRPPDLPDDGVPVAGYVGSVYPWIDFRLIERLCHALPEFRIVIIGKEHPGVRARLAELAQLPNFRFLGPRPYEAVPSYVQHFTVGLVPFLRNELTEGVNPVKLYEYAAAGIPVVSTRFSPDLASFTHIIRDANAPEEFVSAVRESVRLHADPQHRAALVAFARENDWDRKADELWTLIQSTHSSTS